MNYLKLKCLLSYLWIASQCAVTFGGKSPPKKVGEFSAGSFILTQQSLHEAPYRYSGILRDVLDRVEARQPPSQSDEQNCDVRYRIEPSGETETKKPIQLTTLNECHCRCTFSIQTFIVEL